MELQNVSIDILKAYFPELDWQIHSDGEAGAKIPMPESNRFIDPGISIYRYKDGTYSASLYLADDLQIANWIDQVTLEEALGSLRDRMMTVSTALQTALKAT